MRECARNGDREPIRPDLRSQRREFCLHQRLGARRAAQRARSVNGDWRTTTLRATTSSFLASVSWAISFASF